MSKQYKILIVAPAWIGDLVMAQTLFKELKRLNPDVFIGVVAGNFASLLLSRMPEVDVHHVSHFSRGSMDFKKRYQLGCELRSHHYDQAIVLQNSFKSALVPWFAKIPLRTGWIGEMRFGLLNDIRKLDRMVYPLMIERFVALAHKKSVKLGDIQYPKLVITQEVLKQTLQKYNLKPQEKPVLVLCPGAMYGSAKRWPIQLYAELATLAWHANWQVWVLGGGAEVELMQQLQTLTSAECTLLSQTTLGEATDVLAVADAVVSNDSGLMHIAAAVDSLVFGIFGPTSPAFTPPLGKNSVILQTTLDCRPCKARECPLKHHLCMTSITAAQVFAAILQKWKNK